MGFLQTDEALARHCCYADTAPLPAPAPTLQGSEEADVAVVGGGLAGLSAAIELAQRGLRVSLLEARRIGWGPSGRNGGQVIAGLACDMATIEAQLGHTAARAVWDGTLEAIDIIHQRCAQHGIDAQWQPGFINVAVNARKGRALQHSVARMAERYGHLQRWIPPEQMRQWVDSPAYHSGAYDARSGHLHPRKYTLGLARAAAGLGVAIHEDTAVTALTPGARPVLHTAQGRITARQVLLAGNVYLQGLAPVLARRIMPVGTYIVASAPVDPALAQRLIPCGAAVCDNNVVLDYFRFSADHRMVYGGRVSYSTATPMNLADSMRGRMVGTFPQLAGTPVTHAWGGFVDISMNRAPDFGRLPGCPQVYYLQGFSGHGLALTGLAGRWHC